MTATISYLNNFSKAIFKIFAQNTNYELMPKVKLLAILMMGHCQIILLRIISIGKILSLPRFGTRKSSDPMNGGGSSSSS